MCRITTILQIVESFTMGSGRLVGPDSRVLVTSQLTHATALERRRPELIIGLVGAVGTGLDSLDANLTEELERVGCAPIRVRIRDLFAGIAPDLGIEISEKPRDDRRYRALMNAGDELRLRTARGDAPALLAVGEIRELRDAAADNRPCCAFIVHSLKNPAEVDTLRTIYGPSFLLIAAYAPEDYRLERLAEQIARERHERLDHNHRRAAEDLMGRDQNDAKNKGKLGQNVRDTFPLADLFVDVSDRESARISIRRFVECLFGSPFHTPTQPEYAMFLARAAALRSADLGRQVGAVLATSEGDVSH